MKPSSTNSPNNGSANLSNNQNPIANRLKVAMSEFKPKYPTTISPNMQFDTSVIGINRDYYFYKISRREAGCVAFCVAYNAVNKSKNNKELCTHVGSMMCAVSEGFTGSVSQALCRIGVCIKTVYLPSEAGRYNINVNEAPEMGWPSILVTFSCCILLLFQNHTDDDDEGSYKTFMSDHIRQLQGRVGYDPAIADLDVPFDLAKAKAIRTMLGASSTLRETVVNYMMGNLISGDSGTGSVCQYLCSVLAWSWMNEFTVTTKVLVRPQSPVLNDPRVSSEVENLTEACEAVASHPHPQFFMHLASYADQLKVDCSRFPNLFVVALELERGGDGSTVANSAMTGVKLDTVQALVKLHRASNMSCKIEAQP